MKVDRDAMAAARIDRAISPRCAGRVWHGYHAYGCERRGVLQEPDTRRTGELAWWCKQHAPSTRAARDAARNERVGKELAATQRAATRMRAERNLMDLMRRVDREKRPLGANPIIDAWEENQ